MSKKPLLAFVPRSIIQKQQSKSVKKKTSTAVYAKEVSCSSTTSDVPLEDDESDEVKKFSSDQRWPSFDEPVCIICGKYGEYICDQTDEDVCSLQCKQKHLTSVSETQSSHADNSNNVDKNEEAIEDDFHSHFKEHSAHVLNSTINSISEEKMTFFREKLQIHVKGVGIPKLIVEFNQCGFTEQLNNNLKQHHYVTPTTVQMQSIPIIQNGCDTVISATTGSGKTASFLLPIIQKIYMCVGSLSPSHEFVKYPIAVVLAPTRELCMQIEEQAKQFCRSLANMKTALLIGGCPLPQQLHRLRHKIQLVIGTPGRINDIIDNHEGSLNFQQVKMFVLDEVDIMLQMGFQTQIQQILDVVPCKPQYLMFSATIPSSIEAMIDKMLTNPIYVSIGESGLPNKQINQLMLWVAETSKKKKLFSIIDDGKHFLPPVVVFVESKLGADMLCEAITNKFRVHCISIHSNKTQNERTDILQKFLGGAYDILVSTNVMARGIDLVNVKQVIIFDMPKSIDEYVHQIGRAGRLETTGFSIAFINNSSKNLFLELIELFKVTGKKLPDEVLHSPHVTYLEEGRKKKSKGGKRKLLANKEVTTQNLFEILTKNRKM